MSPSRPHIELQHRALIWLANRCSLRGIRGSCEVFLAREYVADAVAIGRLQQRYLAQYIDTRYEDGEFVFCFEAKVSRSDFLSSFGPHSKHRTEKHANLNYIVAAAGVCDAQEIPAGWGLLEQKGHGLSEKKSPALIRISAEQKNSIAYQILWETGRTVRFGFVPQCPDCAGRVPCSQKD